MNVDHLVSTLGYWAVFLLVAAESLGVPLPGETALVVAGAYAGQTHHLNPWIIFAVASAAAIASLIRPCAAASIVPNRFTMTPTLHRHQMIPRRRKSRRQSRRPNHRRSHPQTHRRDRR